MKYKVGDRVKVLKSDTGIKTPYLGIVDNVTSLGDPEIKGLKASGFDKDYAYFHDLDVCDIELAPKTLDNLEVGDVVVDEDGDKLTVLGETNSYKMTLANSKEGGADWTQEELKLCGYKPFTETDEVEVTVEGKTTKISRKSAIALGLLK